METFSAYEWLQIITLGGLVGAIGQGVRVVVGLKKLNDAASAQSTADAPVAITDLIAGDRLLVSLAIGFIAGAVAAMMTFEPKELTALSGTTISGLAAAGYAGADFIEGFMSRALPAAGAPAGTSAVGVNVTTTATAAGAQDGAVG